MKTSEISLDDIARSVWAVPPMPLDDALSPAPREARKIVRHLEAGGVSTVLWAGNAQIQHWPVSGYAALLAMIEEIAGEDTLVVPAAGPDYGKLVDQARMIRRTRFPTALMLPMPAYHAPEGVERGVRTFADICARPVCLYIRSEGYLAPEQLAGLVEEGLICTIKYAVRRNDFRRDDYLSALLDAVPKERVVSGFGELPAVPHLDAFDLASFTAGCVCLAPRTSMRILEALKRGDAAHADELLEPLRPLELLRDRISPIRVIHDAVQIAGIARMGPVLPLLANTPEHERPAIEEAVRTLLTAEGAIADTIGLA